MSNLPTNYVDDVLNADVNTRRKYQMIQNSDGTVSFNDVTDYDTVGSSIGAAQINAQNTKINQNSSAISTLNADLTDINNSVILADNQASATISLLDSLSNYNMIDVYMVNAINTSIFNCVRLPVEYFKTHSVNLYTNNGGTSNNILVSYSSDSSVSFSRSGGDNPRVTIIGIKR
jgi:hypothetical protein